MAADDQIDRTLAVTDTANGYALEEMKADEVRPIGGCQTLDQVISLVTRHVFEDPARLCVAPHRSAAA